MQNIEHNVGDTVITIRPKGCVCVCLGVSVRITPQQQD